MSEIVRNTRKSRLISDFSDAVVELVAEGNKSPSKGDIVEKVVSANIIGTSSAIRSLLTDEMANELERYFSDVCKCASTALGNVDYHLVTSLYYKRRKPVPQSEAEARSFVCVFGNGRTGKSAGVRVPDSSDQPDVMFYIATEKSIDVINKALATQMERLNKSVQSPALGLNQGKMLENQLNKPLLQTQAITLN